MGASRAPCLNGKPMTRCRVPSCSGWRPARERAKTCREPSRALRVAIAFLRSVSRWRKKPHDALLGEIADRELLDAAASLACRELKPQHERVAVAADRVGAEAALTGEKVIEEAHELAAEIGEGGTAHGAPPSRSSGTERAKRSLACCMTSGIRRR